MYVVGLLACESKLYLDGKMDKYKGHVVQIFARGLGERTRDLSDDSRLKRISLVYGIRVFFSKRYIN